MGDSQRRGKARRPGPGEFQGWASRCPLPGESPTQCLLHPAMMCGSVCQVVPLGETSTCVGGPSPAEGKLILSGPRPPGHSYQADSKGSVVTVQELGKGQVFPCPPACPTRRVGKCQDSRPRRARRPGPAQEDRAHPLTLQGLTVQGHGGDRRDVNSGRASFGECFGPREAVGRAVHPCTCPRTSRWLSLHS